MHKSMLPGSENSLKQQILKEIIFLELPLLTTRWGTWNLW